MTTVIAIVAAVLALYVGVFFGCWLTGSGRESSYLKGVEAGVRHEREKMTRGCDNCQHQRLNRSDIYECAISGVWGATGGLFCGNNWVERKSDEENHD